MDLEIDPYSFSRVSSFCLRYGVRALMAVRPQSQDPLRKMLNLLFQLGIFEHLTAYYVQILLRRLDVTELCL